MLACLVVQKRMGFCFATLPRISPSHLRHVEYKRVIVWLSNSQRSKNMGRAPCCEKTGLKKGPWTPEEDQILASYIQKKGHGSWRALPKLAGLLRCGKSCRLRWTNYLRSDIKRGSFTREEERTIIQLHAILGNRWSAIASQLPGRTDNEVKNFWNTHLKKRLLKMGLDPSTHAPKEEANHIASQGYDVLALTRHKVQWENARLEAEVRLSRESRLMCSNSAACYYTDNTVEIITMPSYNPPTDYFLKIWDSEVGKAFRKKSSGRIMNKNCDNSCPGLDQNHPSGGGYDQVLSSEIPKTPRSFASVSSSSCASTQHSCDESLNPNDKDMDNGSQQCNFSSADWIGDCIVKTPVCFADMTVGQTEHKVPEDSFSSEKLVPAHVQYTGFSELLQGFPDDHDSNNSIGCMIKQQSPWPWSEFHLEDDKDCWSNVSFIASAHC